MSGLRNCLERDLVEVLVLLAFGVQNSLHDLPDFLLGHAYFFTLAA